MLEYVARFVARDMGSQPEMEEFSVVWPVYDEQEQTVRIRDLRSAIIMYNTDSFVLTPTQNVMQSYCDYCEGDLYQYEYWGQSIRLAQYDYSYMVFN